LRLDPGIGCILKCPKPLAETRPFSITSGERTSSHSQLELGRRACHSQQITLSAGTQLNLKPHLKGVPISKPMVNFKYPLKWHFTIIKEPEEQNKGCCKKQWKYYGN
jgi:hypothetical protein